MPCKCLLLLSFAAKNAPILRDSHVFGKGHYCFRVASSLKGLKISILMGEMEIINPQKGDDMQEQKIKKTVKRIEEQFSILQGLIERVNALADERKPKKGGK